MDIRQELYVIRSDYAYYVNGECKSSSYHIFYHNGYIYYNVSHNKKPMFANIHRLLESDNTLIRGTKCNTA